MSALGRPHKVCLSNDFAFPMGVRQGEAAGGVSKPFVPLHHFSSSELYERVVVEWLCVLLLETQKCLRRMPYSLTAKPNEHGTCLIRYSNACYVAEAPCNLLNLVAQYRVVVQLVYWKRLAQCMLGKRVLDV